MAEGNKPFVVTDRRKFTMEGDVRPDAERRPEPEVEVRPEIAAPVAAAAGRAAGRDVAGGAGRGITDDGRDG